MYIADFHIHSTFSDGQLTIPQIVDFFGTRGVKAIAITDHICETNTFFGKWAHGLKLTLTPSTFPLYCSIIASETKRAWKKYQMLVIPGFEITKNALTPEDSAHILVLGAKKFISANPCVERILESCTDQGALTFAAHPCYLPHAKKQTYFLWNHLKKFSHSLDGWEVANGQTFFDQVAKTPFPKLASSDFHKIEHFSSWKTTLDCPRNQNDILKAIKSQNLEFKYISEVDFESTNVCQSPNLDYFPHAHPLRNLAIADSA